MENLISQLFQIAKIVKNQEIAYFYPVNAEFIV